MDCLQFEEVIRKKKKRMVVRALLDGFYVHYKVHPSVTFSYLKRIAAKNGLKLEKPRGYTINIKGGFNPAATTPIDALFSLVYLFLAHLLFNKAIQEGRRGRQDGTVAQLVLLDEAPKAPKTKPAPSPLLALMDAAPVLEQPTIEAEPSPPPIQLESGVAQPIVKLESAGAQPIIETLATIASGVADSAGALLNAASRGQIAENESENENELENEEEDVEKEVFPVSDVFALATDAVNEAASIGLESPEDLAKGAEDLSKMTRVQREIYLREKAIKNLRAFNATSDAQGTSTSRGRTFQILGGRKVKGRTVKSKRNAAAKKSKSKRRSSQRKSVLLKKRRRSLKRSSF